MHVKDKIPLIFGSPEDSFFNRLEAGMVFVAELRPELTGMKVVAEKLLKKNIQPVVICDNMMAFCMSRGLVGEVNLFAAQIRENVSLCRTGSLIAALSAKIHNIPVYLYKSALVSLAVSSLLEIDGINVTGQDIKTYSPVFEEVPLELISEERDDELKK
jgi:methylthioribose-1-phosphate isomerase